MPSLEEPDRIAKYFADIGRAASFGEAEALLNEYAVHIQLGRDLSVPEQTLLYTFINVAQRCFRGGITIIGDLGASNLVDVIPGETVGEACNYLGAILEQAAHPGAPIVAIRCAPSDSKVPVYHPVFGHWWGGVSCQPTTNQLNGSALGAVLSAGLTAAAVFTYYDRGRARHCVQTHYMSAWSDTAGFGAGGAQVDGPRIQFLPADLWLAGLGHLGQAYAWLLSLLHYPKENGVRVVLQDDQVIETENRGTSVLCRNNIGEQKTDVVKAWLEKCGFVCFRIERRLGPKFRREDEDPAICLAGLDNIAARRWLANAGFDLLVDGGIGAKARSFSRIRVLTLPGPSTAAELWPDVEQTDQVPTTSAYRSLYDAGIDTCGVTQIANRAVAAPFVGTVASSVVIAQLLKPLHGEFPNHRWTCDLRSPSTLEHRSNNNFQKCGIPIPFCEVS